MSSIARGLAAAVLLVSGALAQAQNIRFPPAPTDAAGAAAGFDARALAVTQYNACGREIDYAERLRELHEENYEKQGEDLGGILIAKVAWLIDGRFRNQPCEHKLEVARPRNPDGTPVHATAEEFMNATLGAWRPNTAFTVCSWATSSVQAAETGLKVIFRVDDACLRQQVNVAIRAMGKDSQMGTDALPCFASFSTGNTGDYDVVVRELVRLHYMGTATRVPVLERSTIDHMYENLLAARGGLSDSSYSVLSDCDDPAGDELGSPEDFADRESWYNELFEAIGDFFKWLAELFFHIVGSALASAAGLIAAPFMIASGDDPTELLMPHADIRVPETENHRLMIESSKYLTNEKILAELRALEHDNIDEIQEKQDEVRDWLLQTLRTITINDFEEYNSRPYTRYSLNAILNLHDFAADERLRTASRIVLDLSGAKFAAASNRGRRVVPYRRLSEFDDKGLYEMVHGADHEVVRAVVLAGQTQHLGGGLHRGAVTSMVHSAVSPYRWPRPALEVAVERPQAVEQDVAHAGVEGFYSEPPFTMSLGGVQRPAALDLLGIERGVDRGVAMPTVIIPATAGHFLGELFAMNGNGSQHNRTDNLCGYKGFICGIQPTLSTVYSGCMTGTVLSGGPDFFFVNSAACPGMPAPHFYLAFKRGQCNDTFCEHGRVFGFMDIVAAPAAQPSMNDPGFRAFQTSRRAALGAVNPDGNGVGTYVNAAGESIRFVVADAASHIVSINGAPRRPFATRGDVINATGDGRVVIGNPWSPAKVIIDYTNWNAPLRGDIP